MVRRHRGVGRGGTAGHPGAPWPLARWPQRCRSDRVAPSHPSDQYLREILARGSKLLVLIAGQGEFLKASTCYIGEPDHHLTVMANSLDGLVDDPGDQYRNRKIDLLFRSVALEAQERAIGVVLSGALDDGSRGLEAIQRAGGRTMVLTPKPWPVLGMPENAIGFNGPIDLIGSAPEIAATIAEAVGQRSSLVP